MFFFFFTLRESTLNLQTIGRIVGVGFAGQVGEGVELGPEVVVDDGLPGGFWLDEIGGHGSTAHLYQLRERERDFREIWERKRERRAARRA